MIKSELFDEKLRELSDLAKVMAHPARLSILNYLSNCTTCISGDISDVIPLSRTTVSQHLKELKKYGFIKGEVDGLKIHYCLDQEEITRIKSLIDEYFNQITHTKSNC